MDDLRRMMVFAAVVQHRSMSAAARALRMTPSAISQQVKVLERRAGVTLLLRTTRSMTLTDAGERFHEACAAMVSAAERARAELVSARDEPVGELRISAPVGFARHLQSALRNLMCSHPALKLCQILDDERRDLVASRIDLAIAFGALPDSDWSARRLGTFEMWLCASPDYPAGLGAPTKPEQLAQHPWIGSGSDNKPSTLALSTADGRSASVVVTPRIAANNQDAIELACSTGLGMAALSSLDVSEQVAAGRLVRVLRDWTAGTLDIWAMTSQRDAQPAKVRLAVQAIEAYLRNANGTRR